MMSNETEKVVAILAEFSGTTELIHGAEKMRDAGYKRFDCHSPFPIHGMDEAMGLGRSPVGYIAGVFGFAGGSFGLWLQWYTSAVDYPLVISGKPFFSGPAFVPVIFALTILFAAIGAVGSMILINRFPRLHHPVFYSDNFPKATDDGFFISVECDDDKFDEQKTVELLSSIGSTRVEVLRGE